jgi:hypothetical protein
VVKMVVPTVGNFVVKAPGYCIINESVFFMKQIYII